MKAFVVVEPLRELLTVQALRDIAVLVVAFRVAPTGAAAR